MNSKEYQSDALVTDLMSYEPMYERLGSVKAMRLLHAGMGLCTESGEFVDMLKKHILYGKDLDEVNLAEEIGDIFWYAALACDELGVSFESVMQKNIEKLRARYPNKFTEHDAIHRDLDKERKILESSSNA